MEINAMSLITKLAQLISNRESEEGNTMIIDRLICNSVWGNELWVWSLTLVSSFAIAWIELNGKVA